MLVGRDPSKLAEVGAEIVALDLPIIGVLNNAGIMSTTPAKTAQGWDVTFTTDHPGPFAFTEALIPHLRAGANVVFTCSGVEDPERKPAVMAGFRGGRYISAEASAHGEWAPGGSSHPGFDAYATSKQGNLATVFVFARRRRGSGSTPSSQASTRAARTTTRTASRCSPPRKYEIPHSPIGTWPKLAPCSPPSRTWPERRSLAAQCCGSSNTVNKYIYRYLLILASERYHYSLSSSDA